MIFASKMHVPEDHLLRQTDPFHDLTPLRDHLAPFYSHTGRTSIAPELMLRMLIIGYCFGIRSAINGSVTNANTNDSHLSPTPFILGNN